MLDHIKTAADARNWYRLLKGGGPRFLAIDELHNMLTIISTYHPDGAALVRGVELARVQRNENGTTAMWLLSERGGQTVSGSRLGEQPMETVMHACRHAIIEQTAAARTLVRWGVDRCVVTGEVLHETTSDVDHMAPWYFADIVKAWCADISITPEQLVRRGAVARISDSYDRPMLTDSGGGIFARFHKDRARLRVITSYANRVVLLRDGHNTKRAKELNGFFRLG